jgi:hypothetical protein
MSTKMQQLLDLIVNEETEKANELFHEIVVERSREIYENLIAEEEEEEMDESSEEDDEEMDESTEDDEEDLDENFGMDADADKIGGDPADDMVGDTEFGDDDMGGEEGGAPATKDDVQDLEDALAELKAEFEALMGGEGEEEMGDEFGDEEGGEEDGEEFGDEESDEDEMESDEEDDEEDDEEADESMGLREYRETVGNDWDKNSQKEQGKNLGSGSGENYPAPTEGRSPVSSGKGKPTTGANAKNILGNSGKTAEGTNTGTATNADKGSRGLVGATKGEFTKGVEKNISRSSKTGMKDGAALDKVSAGHGSERKGGAPGPVGAGKGNLAGQTSVGKVQSPINGAPNRNA